MSEDNKVVTFDACAEAAQSIGIEPCVLYAIYVVEAGGKSGFLSDGRAKILFEAHVFWKQLVKHGINPEPLYAANKDILLAPRDNNAAARKRLYKGGAAEYPRLDKAMEIHKAAALESASWASFQIMGFNYEVCGYANVFDFVLDMETSAVSQLTAVCNFLKGNNLLNALKGKDWNRIARVYNGPAYADGNYHGKLRDAYTKCAAQKR